MRASLLVASVIPLSMLIAFAAMWATGASANLMSLGALDFGLLVDGAIVMVDQFVRQFEGQDSVAAPGVTPAQRRARLRRAALDVARPVLFGVSIIVAVYIPIFTLDGMEGRMFRPMAFTVVVAVLGSLLLALTYVPGRRGSRAAPRDAKPSRAASTGSTRRYGRGARLDARAPRGVIARARSCSWWARCWCCAAPAPSSCRGSTRARSS